jgi:hypothetical protein
MSDQQGGFTTHNSPQDKTLSVLDLPPTFLYKYTAMSLAEKASLGLLPHYYNISDTPTGFQPLPLAPNKQGNGSVRATLPGHLRAQRRAQVGVPMLGGATYTHSEIYLFNQEPWLKAKWEQLGKPLDK